jgi:alanyl-tRNA synthetase
MKTDELREKYLAFFESKGHTRCASDVLVPRWDPSVLFTPAGMNPFKDHFLGKVKLEFTRATSCQKCLRTGDIDNVGRTAYHHTFFEMLGNFSFGDYFKREAIHWAWEFLTDKKWLGVNPDQLSVTVYLDDDEAAGIWQKDIGLPTSRIERMGEDDNFWPASAPSKGPDGVCGPCSEIYFHPEGKKSVEIWNLVFTQFNRVGDPPNNLRPLPSKNIDTGMGLERIASVMQGVDTNYHIDILRPLVEAAGEVCGLKYDPASDNGRRLRRIADHVRACTFAIHENVLPGPKKQNYVIRRLMRRAILDGYQLGKREPFMFQLVNVVADLMKSPYPELSETVSRVSKAVSSEETQFLSTLDSGLPRVQQLFQQMQSSGRLVVTGKELFMLYSTYGFPPELVEALAADEGLGVDMGEYVTICNEPGPEGPTGPLFQSGPIDSLKKALKSTPFLGYDTTEVSAEIKGIVSDDHLRDSYSTVGQDNSAIVVLDKSPFYAESGGQVGDTGQIVGTDFEFQVTDTQKNGDLILHKGYLQKGSMPAGAKVTAKVDTSRRLAIRRAHSATHIMHYALQKNLGKDAHQMGSKVEEDWLRFDFGNPSPVDVEHLAAIERDVAERVAAAEPIGWKFVPLTEARAAGAMMLFGEKYPDPARMVSMGSFSRELCGGTHLDNTKDVGPFEIIAEEGVAAGTRRIVALTGAKAKEHVEKTQSALQEMAKTLGVGLLDIPTAAKNLAQQVRDLKKQLSSGSKGGSPETVSRETVVMTKAVPTTAQTKAALREAARALNVGLFDAPARVVAMLGEVEGLKKQISQRSQSGELSAASLLAKAETIGSAKVIVAEAPGANANLMRQLIDQIRKQVNPAAIFLAAAEGEGKVLLVAGITKDLVEKGHSAGNWVRDVAPIVGGGGGGKPDLAQAGGKQPEKLSEALAKARELARAQFA